MVLRSAWKQAVSKARSRQRPRASKRACARAYKNFDSDELTTRFVAYHREFQEVNTFV